ncbi:MAG: hypothetical protein H0W84_14725 [Bacteroidetes bacterium]|nr:hypothetical protein [Bacteroidota bacterium]
MKKIFISTVVIVSALAACKTTKTSTETKSVALDCSGKTFTYALDIKPIMEQYCTSCHNKNEKAGYNLLELEFVKKAATNGYLLGTIKHASGFSPMPEMAPKMDQPTIDKIECWINNGMKE